MKIYEEKNSTRIFLGAKKSLKNWRIYLNVPQNGEAKR